MGFAIPERCLRQTSSVLYIAVDTLIPLRGRSLPGLDEFTAALVHAGIPAVSPTSHSPLQVADPRRNHTPSHPFAAEHRSACYQPPTFLHTAPEPMAPRTT